MKIFVCSDVHGNVRALDAALAVYREHAPCRLLFLGDAVGYGAHPDACLDRLLSLPRGQYLLGNHEWALLDPGERINLNETAAEAIAWTERELGGRYNDALLRLFHLTVRDPRFIAAHASPNEPEEWPYLHTEHGARAVFEAADFDLCFVGHTHVPVVYTSGGGPMELEPERPLLLDPSDRHIVNPGSVGQPRDGDPRASCCVYDPGERTVTLYRREYDIEAEADEMLSAGLPAFLAERLFSGW
ncbi:MAG: metallophosphoesterase family protein [Candidatus Krumholzibacteria bacterium]|nr:metallophosphoesterase family protein [Candidatus Krumholzibacteria bacterium]